MSTSLRDIVLPVRPLGDPDRYDASTIKDELIRLSNPSWGCAYFIENYCKIFSNDVNSWIPFIMWRKPVDPYDNQIDVLNKILTNKRIIIAKSRQMGQTWLCLSYFLYKILFNPIQVILLLSRGREESVELMKRIRGIYVHLPRWLRVKEESTVSKTYWELSNGSKVMSLSSASGDSYSCTAALCDESDILHMANTGGLAAMLMRLEPTIGRNGQLILLSKMDKSRPNSTFKNMFRAALAGEIPYAASFIPWQAHEDRDDAWHAERERESLAVDGTRDQLFENYPSDLVQLFSVRSTDKRLPFDWVHQCYVEEKPLTIDQIRNLYDPKAFEKHSSVFSIPHIQIFRLPKPGEEYIITADCAEGLMSSDNSSLHVLSRTAKEECLLINGKFEPSTLAYYTLLVGRMYNRAKVLPERNHHGHAYILWLRDNGEGELPILQGMDKANNNSLNVQKRYGWSTTSVSKSVAFSKTADALCDKTCVIHSRQTFEELCSIRESNLEAPVGQHDDAATTFVLGIAAIDILLNKTFSLEFI